MEPSKDNETLELRKKLERQSDVVNMMVHDLKGPLMEVMANIDLIMNSPDVSENDKDCAETAMAGCNNLLQTITDMLNFGKMEQDMYHPQLKPFDLSQLASEELRKVSRQAGDRNISLALKNDWQVTVRGDRAVIARVIANLISNGLKFSPNGSVLQVRVERRGQDARFTVKDLGPGIPEEYREYIFDKYVQLDLRTHHKPGGTGLGLTFCKMAVVAHDGKIALEDSPVGSEFYFELPLYG